MGRSFHGKTAKMNIPLRAAAVLLCAVLFSAYSVTGLFARYTTSTRSSDEARVAKFSIVGSGELWESLAAELVPGGSQEVDLIIENNSEVAVEYTVEVANVTRNLPLTLRMVKEGSSAPLGDANGIKFTVQQFPDRHEDKYKLTIDWPVTGEKDREPDKMGMVDYITVKITAVQID